MKKRSDEKTDEKMTGGDAASVREHVLSPEEYLSQIEFLDDDFEFQHKDGLNMSIQTLQARATGKRQLHGLRKIRAQCSALSVFCF